MKLRAISKIALLFAGSEGLGLMKRLASLAAAVSAGLGRHLVREIPDSLG